MPGADLMLDLQIEVGPVETGTGKLRSLQFEHVTNILKVKGKLSKCLTVSSLTWQIKIQGIC